MSSVFWYIGFATTMWVLFGILTVVLAVIVENTIIIIRHNRSKLIKTTFIPLTSKELIR